MSSDDTTATTDPDPVMARITAAVVASRAGGVAGPRAAMIALWRQIGVDGDALHRCTLAHHLADMYDDAAQALMWDVRALDAADALTDSRARSHHPTLSVAGFYPSLHLNIADNLRRLGSFDAAGEHLDAARRRVSALPDDDYGRFMLEAINGVAADLDQRSTARRS